MRRDLIARAALVVVAVLVIGWLGVMERNVRLQAQAVRDNGRRDFAGAAYGLRRADLLNPDTTPDLSRSLLLLLSDRPSAVATIEHVLRREPENITAWRYLSLATAGRDPATNRRAIAALRRLDPVDARRRSR